MRHYILYFFILLFFGCSNENKKEVKSVEDNSKLANENIFSNSNSSSFLIEKEDISFDLPKGWIKEELSEDTYAFRENCPDTANFCTNLVVRIVKNDSKLNSEQVVDVFVTSLPQRFKTMQIVSVLDQKINDFDFKIVDYKVFENQVHLGSSTAFLTFDDKIISFYFTAENKPAGSFAQKRKLFLDILNSLKV